MHSSPQAKVKDTFTPTHTHIRIRTHNLDRIEDPQEERMETLTETEKRDQAKTEVETEHYETLPDAKTLEVEEKQLHNILQTKPPNEEHDPKNGKPSLL